MARQAGLWPAVWAVTLIFSGAVGVVGCGLNPQPEVPADEDDGVGGAAGGGGVADPRPGLGLPSTDDPGRESSLDSNYAGKTPTAPPANEDDELRPVPDAGPDADVEGPDAGPPVLTM